MPKALARLGAMTPASEARQRDRGETLRRAGAVDHRGLVQDGRDLRQARHRQHSEIANLLPDVERDDRDERSAGR